MASVYSIGESLPRKDGRDKVTGRAKFGADVDLPGQLYAAVYHSPYPHAVIEKLDVSKALALPGVRAVVTGEDCKARYGLYIADQPVFAQGKVRYYGEPVAGVVAGDEATARRAARLIEATYTPLPVVDTIEKALKGDVLLHEDWEVYPKASTHPVQGTNIVDRYMLIHGDVEQGFAEADVIVENEFYCDMLQHSVIEPHAAIADANADGVRVYAPAQSPFSIRPVLAKAFGYTSQQVRLTCAEIGGGFGCKAEAKLEPIVIALSRAVHRPVKLVYDRAEEYKATLTRAPALFKIKTGATRSGKLCAQSIHICWDTGAYGTFGPRVNYNAGYASNGPYFIPHCHVQGDCLVTNKPLGTAYRGFGITEVACAHELQMDALAKELNMDPLEFRLKNVLRDGMESVTGERMQSVGVSECLERAAEAIGWKDMPQSWVTPDGKLHGKGIACFIKLTGTPSTTSCLLRMNDDGTLTILSGSREMGQGVLTVLPQIAASVLGLDVGKITVSPVDTAFTPYDKTTTSSRSTFHSGKAVMEAAQDILEQLRRLTAKKWQCDVSRVAFADGLFTCLDNSSLSLHINDVGKSGVMREELPVAALGKFGSKDVFDPPDPDTHASKRPTIMWMMGAQAAEVEVDPETGVARVVQMGAAHDVGKAINPMGCLQQIEGGVNMGTGHALLEEMIFDKGILLNGNMADYKVPTAMEADFDTHVVLVEHAHPEGPYGVKGIGEPGVAPTAPAIANAIGAACGARFHATPIRPDQILATLKAKE